MGFLRFVKGRDTIDIWRYTWTVRTRKKGDPIYVNRFFRKTNLKDVEKIMKNPNLTKL